VTHLIRVACILHVCILKALHYNNNIMHYGTQWRRRTTGKRIKKIKNFIALVSLSLSLSLSVCSDLRSLPRSLPHNVFHSYLCLPVCDVRLRITARRTRQSRLCIVLPSVYYYNITRVVCIGFWNVKWYFFFTIS